MVQPIVADAGPPPGDNPGDWQLHRWTLRYQRKAHAPFPELEASFQARQSVRYAVPLRVVTVLFFAVNVVLVYFDWVRFMSGGQAGLGLPPRPVDPAMFSAATAIRLGGMLPLCVAILVGVPSISRRSALVAVSTTVDAVAYAVMVYMIWPGRSQPFFKISPPAAALITETAAPSGYGAID